MIVYDIEVLPNIFTVMFSDGSLFEISWRRNEVKKLIKFLTGVEELVGFNNLEYDYPLLHFIIDNQDDVTIEAIHRKSIQLIETPFGQGWRNRIYDSEQHVKQIDLRLIHHFDRASGLVSLKALQFAMCLPNIKEFPHGFDKCLTSDGIEELILYQQTDIASTVELLNRSKEKIDLRRKFASSLGTSCLNYNDGKLGGKYFENELNKSNPGCLLNVSGGKNQTLHKPDIVIPEYTTDASYNNGLPVEFHLPEKPILNDISVLVLERIDFKTEKQYESALNKQKKEAERIAKKNQGDLSRWLKKCKEKHEANLNAVWIPVKSLIFDYIGFEHPEFQRILGLYQNYNITRTKGGFSETCTIDDFVFHFGQGGIHGSVKNSTIRSNEKYIIRDIDISGAYPKIAIVNGLYPAHFGEGFCKIYEDVFQQRKKHKKGTVLNLALKLAVNAVFGNSINEYSVFYDPAFGMQITINCQLLFCMLAEQLMKLGQLQLIQINTDGLTIRYPREFTPWVESIEKWWMALTKLQLETVNYQAMFIRDVNNYIGWFENGERKRKGVFAYEVRPGELELNKDHSGLIVPKAVEAFFTLGVDVEEFIHNHSNPLDFMLRGKVDRNTELFLEEQIPLVGLTKAKQQRTIRFYFSNTGGELFKYMLPLQKEKDLAKQENREPKFRRNAYQGSKDYNVSICNDINDFDSTNVNFDYYIDAAKKIIVDIYQVGATNG